MVFKLPSPSSIWLQWYEVDDGYINGILQGFKLSYQDTTKPDPPIVLTLSSAIYSTTLHGLPSFVEFKITLRAFTVKGDGPALEDVIRTDENG